MDPIHHKPISFTKDETQVLSSPLTSRRRLGLEKRHSLSMGILLTLILCVTTLLIRQFTFVVHVKVDGEIVGAVSDSQMFEDLVDTAADTVFSVLGTPYIVEDRISYVYRLANVAVLETLDPLPVEREILERIEGLGLYYAISIDGEAVGHVSDLATLQTAKEERLVALLDEGALSAVFLSEVAYEPEVREAGDALTIVEILSLVDELSVQTVREITYMELIPFDVTIVADDTLFDDVVEVLQVGVEGEIQVFAQVTQIDGREVVHTILERKILADAVSEIILEGALERPLTASFGAYIWPTTGTVSSFFGPRWGVLHQGIDIVAPHGTPVYAADGGEVFFVGWFGGYGNIIKILHDNGHVTYYAHLSSMYVLVGDLVYRGQHIGGVGTTGHSTGNHLHFEIRIDGVPVDPMPWLP